MDDRYKEVMITSKPTCMDMLDNIPLKDGERLEVIWPDGTHTFETIRVKTWKNKNITYSKAHIIVFWKNVPAVIRLVGLRTRRITNETH